jgi:hypothetical protein
MAETRFFMTREDTLEFVVFLIDLVEAEFVPEISVHPPPFPRFTTLAQTSLALDGHGQDARFFVLSRHWERFPLFFNEVHANDGRHFFAVSPRVGGPAFDFIPARVFIDGDVRCIVPGSFVDYPYYIEDGSFMSDPSTYRTCDRPEAMTKTHKEVHKYLRRKGCRTICRARTGPWTLPGALRQYESGTWLRVGDWHFEPKPISRRRATP